jgi:glycine cleavage system regulatory protein
MTPIIFTLVGQDKPKLISSLANTVYDMGGNWLGSNLSHMAGHFAGFVHVTLPEAKHSELIELFAKHPDLKIHVLSGQDTSTLFERTAQIEIMGNDRAGIVQELTEILNHFNLNIIKFASSLESAPNWGNPLFKAKVLISIANDFDFDDLTGDLEAVANDLMVDIEIQ